MTDAFGPTRILHNIRKRVIEKFACRQTDSRQTGKPRLTNRKVLQLKANVSMDYQRLATTLQIKIL